MARRLQFVVARTGGGHRAAAEAVQAEIEAQGLPLPAALVDLYEELSPFPLSQLPRLYRPLADGLPPLWAALWRASALPLPGRLVLAVNYGLMRARLLGRLRRSRPRGLVSFHPLANHALVRARRELGLTIPLVTVVTDLATAHPFWFAPGIDDCLVPTEEARERALRAGLPAQRVEVVGLPVHPRFRAVKDPLTYRRRLGLEDRPTVLVVGGGEGMGPILEVARGLARSAMDLQLILVAGRNEGLRRRLEAQSWPRPVRVLGFVEEMPELMGASDLLVSKAGPSTVMEALTVGLPLLLMGFLPGQEEGNVRYVVAGGAGFLTPTPGEVVRRAREVLQDPSRLAGMRAAARRLAHPGAARAIAGRLAELCGSPGPAPLPPAPAGR